MGFWNTLAKVGGGIGGFALGGVGGAMAGYSLGDALTSGGGGGGGDTPASARHINADPAAAQAALNASSKAAAESALPAFKDTLQGIGESTQRRGVENGEIAGGYMQRAQGDFMDRISRAIASGAQDQYKTGLEVQAGNLDRDQAAENAARASSSNRLGAILNAGATVGGAYLSGRGRSDAVSAGAPTTLSPRPALDAGGSSSFSDALSRGFKQLRG